MAAQDVLHQIRFYNMVSNHLWFKGSAGYMFETIVLAWLCANSESSRTPAQSASPQLTIPMCQGCCMLSSKEQHDLGDLNDRETPFCVIPVSKAFPSVDAMIITDNHIITIQVTVASKHSVKSTGFLQIVNKFPKGFQMFRKWCHVFVTDRAKNAASLLTTWTERDLELDGDINIPIYSAVLDVNDFCRIQSEEERKESWVCGSRLYVLIETD
ncbi:hypothetical protein B0F90DRAFT_591568 [Multifurca ochricompacta]|uniref:Uncharacterized protein n=1 Tax=Multifurca ochricompacta TaxID=376703 RepID=A0AAD4QIZ5_9AGAM|nr:hypothetical protein B0F90DRAFT_591568 [Multifurca ochricompacta]